MTASPSSLGALYISVSLDTTRARRQLQDFQSQMRRASATGVAGVGGRGQAATLGQTATGLNKVAAAANNVGRSSKGLSTFRKELTTTAAILAPGRAGTALYGIGALGRAMTALGPAGAGASAGMIAITGAAITAGAAVIALGVGLGKLTSVGVDAGRKLETLTVSLNTLMGPAAAKAEIGWLIELAQVSPFLTDTIINMDKMLFAQGLVADGMRRGLIKSVTDMGAALGLTDDNLDSLTYALSQVQARGYLTGDEARQLANQFVPIWKMLQELPEFAGMTTTQLRKLSEEGKISAQTLFEAFQTYSERFAGAAEAQANTLTGLILRFQDFRNAIGLAFLEVESSGTGPIEVLRNALRTLNDQISKVDWRPISAAIGDLLSSVFSPLTNMLNRSGSVISFFFEELLPRVVGAITAVVRMVRAAFIGFGDTLSQFGVFVVPVMQLIGGAFLAAFAGILIGINAVINGLGILFAVIRTMMNFWNAFMNLLAGDNVNFVKSWNAAMDSMSDGAGAFVNLIDGVFGVLEGAVGVINSLSGAGVPTFASIVGDAEEPVDNLNDALGATEEAGKGAARGADEARRAMGELFDLIQRFLGQRSELEKGFLGAEGFTATTDSIISMAKTLINALREIGATETLELVERSTLALLELARQRDLVAEKLEDAENHLSEAIKARDEFARRIREQSIAFANALQTESEAVTRFRSFTRDGVLFFIEEETTKQKSFVETLKERVQALKDFLRNIKTLAARGLDKGLLETIFAAGPEQGGAIAAGLAAGGQAMIGEVNALQGQLGNVADQLSDFGAKAFYQAGVDQAQAIVDGLQAEQDAITGQAEAITALVYAAIVPWAKKFKDEGGKAARAGGAGLSGGIPAIDDAMAGVNLAVERPTEEWDAFMQHGGSTASTMLSDIVIPDWMATFDTWVTETPEKLKAPFLEFQDWLKDFHISIDDGNINFWNIPAKFFDAISDMLTNPWIAGIGNILTMGGLGVAAVAAGAAASFFWNKYQSTNRAGITGGTGNILPSSAIGVQSTSPSPNTNTGFSTTAVTQASALSQASVPQVNVYIGEEPLTTLVQTELVVQGASQTSHIVRGRRA